MRREMPYLILLLVVAFATEHATAQQYPTKSIRMIVAFAPGGPNDIIARIIGQKLTEAWSNTIVVDNRPGAGGNIGTELVAKAAPDGYTLSLVSTAFVVNPSLYNSAGYDALRDFAPVTLAAVSPVIIVAHPSFTAKDVRELVQLAKRTTVDYASPGTGTTGHLGGELFNTVAGIKMQHIPYKGAGPAITEIFGGQVKLGFTAVPPAAPHIRSGKLRAIAVTTLHRTAALLDVPTVAESGFPGFSVDNMYGVVATGGTPHAVVEKLNREIVRIVRNPEVRERLANQGFDPMGNSPEEFAVYLRSELRKWAQIVKESGARAD